MKKRVCKLFFFVNFSVILELNNQGFQGRKIHHFRKCKKQFLLFAQIKNCTNFLHLELDGCLNFVDFVDKFLGVRAHRRELSGFVEARPEQSRNLFDEHIGGNERVILLG